MQLNSEHRVGAIVFELATLVEHLLYSGLALLGVKTRYGGQIGGTVFKADRRTTAIVFAVPLDPVCLLDPGGKRIGNKGRSITGHGVLHAALEPGRADFSRRQCHPLQTLVDYVARAYGGAEYS